MRILGFHTIFICCEINFHFSEGLQADDDHLVVKKGYDLIAIFF